MPRCIGPRGHSPHARGSGAGRARAPPARAGPAGTSEWRRRGGVVHGETDDFSYNVVRDPVHIRDLNATMLHCLGLDHERLSIKHQGLDVRLTSVEPARVVGELLA